MGRSALGQRSRLSPSEREEPLDIVPYGIGCAGQGKVMCLLRDQLAAHWHGGWRSSDFRRTSPADRRDDFDDGRSDVDVLVACNS